MGFVVNLVQGMNGLRGESFCTLCAHEHASIHANIASHTPLLLAAIVVALHRYVALDGVDQNTYYLGLGGTLCFIRTTRDLACLDTLNTVTGQRYRLYRVHNC